MPRDICFAAFCNLNFVVLLKALKVFVSIFAFCSYNMKKQKRERSANFSQEETDRLVKLVVTKKHVVENKKSDATTWQEKEKAWKDIEKAFNSGSVFRDHKGLKLKYEAIKRDARKKIAMEAERYKICGKTSIAPRLTSAEEQVKRILLSVEGTEGFPASDSDLVLPATSTSSSAITRVPDKQSDQPPTASVLSDDLSKNVIIKIEDEDDEAPNKKVCAESENETLLQSETDPLSDCDDVSEAENQWQELNPTALKSTKPVLSNPKEERYFDKLSNEKLEIAKIQRKILEKEFEHKELIYELEKQHLLLKIKLLKKELGEI